MGKPKIFISYSHEDEEWIKLFKTSLKARFKDEFEIWHDRDIKIGKDWFNKIINSIHDTKIAILLISNDFLTSMFINNKEIPRFRKQAEDKNLKLVPVIISSCAWDEYSWLSSIQGYPKDNKPLDTFWKKDNISFDKCPNIRKEINELTKRIKKEYEDESTSNKESKKLINTLTDFLLESSITPKELKEISKHYIENEINQREIDQKTTLKDIIDYLDNLIINNKSPIFCIINHIYQQKSSNNQKIKKWIETGYNNDSCEQIKVKANKLLEKKKYFFEQNKELAENRIILDFKHTENKQNKFDVYIHYFKDGKFTANKEPIFLNIDIDNEEFQKKLVNYFYNDNIANKSYPYLNILLPKPILLTNIKQWKDGVRKRLTKAFIINIHLRERAILKEKKAYIDIWNDKSQQFNDVINKALKPMESENDEATKDTEEAGLIYLYQPDKEIFYDDMFFSLISVRCSDDEKYDEYQKIWQEQNDMSLIEFKNFIDQDANRYITLIWDDPKIPLKGEWKNE